MSDQQNYQFNSPPPTKRKTGRGGSSSKSRHRSQVNIQLVNMVEILNEDSETVMKKYVSVTIENQDEIVIQEVNQISGDARKDIELCVSEQKQCLQEYTEIAEQNNNQQKSNVNLHQEQHTQQPADSQHERQQQKPFQQSIHYEVFKQETNLNKIVVDQQDEDKHTDIDIDIDEPQSRLNNNQEQQPNGDQDSWSARRPSQMNAQEMIGSQRMEQFEKQFDRQQEEARINNQRGQRQEKLMEMERQMPEEEPKAQETITSQPICTSNEYNNIFVLGSQQYYHQLQQHQQHENHHDIAIDHMPIANHQELVEYNIIQQQIQANELMEVCESQQQNRSSVEVVDTIPFVNNYTIVVKQSPAKECVQEENGFYKNNDIYGVEGVLQKGENILEVENQQKDDHMKIQWYDKQVNQHSNDRDFSQFKTNNGEDFDMSGPSTEELNMVQQQQQQQKQETKEQQQQQQQLPPTCQQQQSDNFFIKQPQKEHLQVEESLAVNRSETSLIERNNEELPRQTQQELLGQQEQQTQQESPVQQEQQPSQELLPKQLQQPQQQELPQQNQQPQQELPGQLQQPQQAFQQHPQQQQQQQSAQNNFSLAQQSTNDFTINDSLRSNVAIRGSEFPQINQSTDTNTYAYPQRNQQQQIHNHNLNVVMQHITETQSESKKSKIPSQEPPQFGGSSSKNKTKFIHPTEQKNTQEEQYQVRFFVSNNGHNIYTVQCFKDHTSQLNKVFKLYNQQQQQQIKQQKQLQRKQEEEDEKSKMTQTQYRIQTSSFYSPSQQPSMGRYVMVEISDHQHSEQDKAFHKEKVQSQLENSISEVREIHYRNQKQLTMILDYLKIEQNLQKGGHEEIIDMFMKNDKLQVESGALSKEQNEEPKIVWREDEPIKKSNMYQNQPHNIADEQLDVSNVSSFLSRPHPTEIIQINQNLEKKQDQQQQKQSSSKKSKRVTKKKKPDEVVNFQTYLKKESSKKSKNSQVSFEPKGSMYKYELIQKRDKQRLVQVRRSGRIFSKSKVKLQQQFKSQDQNDQNNEQFNAKMSHRKPRQASSSKKKQTSHKRSSKKFMQKTQENHKKNEEVTLDWLKKHISELNEIVVENVYMEDQYKAMTQKDAEIAKFLDSLERREIEIKKEQKNEQKHEPKKQFVREDRIMKPSKRRPQSRTTSKKSKHSKAPKSVQKRKPHMTKKQLSKRSNIKIERTIEVSVKKQQMKQYEDQIQQYENPGNNDLVKLQDENGVERSFNSSNENRRKLTHDEKIKLFDENKKLYRVPDEFPLTIQKIVNPDILNLGVYALVKLGRFSEFQLGTPYAITPICEINFAKINDVKKSVEESKKLVPKEYQDNIALVALNKKMLELIENAKNKRENLIGNNKNGRTDIQQSEDIQI